MSMQQIERARDMVEEKMMSRRGLDKTYLLRSSLMGLISILRRPILGRRSGEG